MLGAVYLEHLSQVASRAKQQVEIIPNRFEVSALKLLCSEIQTLVSTYIETRNKYEGGPSPSVSLAAALEELELLRKELQAVAGPVESRSRQEGGQEGAQ